MELSERLRLFLSHLLAPLLEFRFGTFHLGHQVHLTWLDFGLFFLFLREAPHMFSDALLPLR